MLNKLTPSTLQRILRAIFGTQPYEISCDECFSELSCFAEMTLSGLPAAEAMPLVQQHLARCRDCREEYEALLVMLRRFP